VEPRFSTDTSAPRLPAAALQPPLTRARSVGAHAAPPLAGDAVPAAVGDGEAGGGAVGADVGGDVGGDVGRVVGVVVVVLHATARTATAETIRAR
jgi:hypothetical protein